MKRSLKNRILAAVFAACLLFVSVEMLALAADSGSCGSKAKWSLGADGTLSITGKGSMQNFTEGNMAPWYENREKITSVTIKKGITNIGDLAFYGCTSLQSISFPETVVKIGDMAFAGCTNLARVTLQDGLKSIGANAFSRCESLRTVRLPDGLLNIGYQAFYRCSSLSTIRIPVTTTNLSESIFAYCDNLMQVVIESPIAKLPEWTFYGCTSLTSVSLPSSVQNIGEYAFHDCDSLKNAYHDGTDEEREQISNQIQSQLPDFTGVSEGDSSNVGSSTTGSVTQKPDGSVVGTDREIVDTDDSTIDTTVNVTKPSIGKDEYDITIDVTIDDKDGWDDMLEYTDSYIKYPERLEDDSTTVNKVDIHVNLNGSTKIPGDVLESLAGHKVKLTISTSTNSSWIIDCENLDADQLSKAYDLKFTLKKNSKPTKAQMKLIGNAQSYILEFEENIPFEVTVTVPLGYSYAKHLATICQKPVWKSWEIMQSTIIDAQGDALFYLSSLDKQTKYLVAIDMEGISLEDVLIPDSMADEYGNLTDAAGNKYVLTGTQSSWGISFWQLTLIVFGVITLSGIVVGVIIKIQFRTTNNKK
ncbi:MAG: leucine-rich repeat domain-containing protein [Faecalimonas sp.]|nr:leucine-rich repeat domain-containing protein [Faecalimonas sp.]